MVDQAAPKTTTERTDTDRLNWLETEANGIGLVHDDNRHWAVSGTGMQNVVTGDDPHDVQTTFFVEAREWRKTIREAIDAAMDGEE
jgi:hypothetical protein